MKELSSEEVFTQADVLLGKCPQEFVGKPRNYTVPPVPKLSRLQRKQALLTNLELAMSQLLPSVKKGSPEAILTLLKVQAAGPPQSLSSRLLKLLMPARMQARK